MAQLKQFLEFVGNNSAGSLASALNWSSSQLLDHLLLFLISVPALF